MRFLVDRIEEKIAYCITEDNKHFDIDISLLPQNTKEQDWLVYTDGDYKVDFDFTQKMKEKNLSLYNKLKK